MNKEEKDALNKVKEELFKEYSAYEYKKAFMFLMKNRKKYKNNDEVKNALYDYLEKHHDKNKCWRNKL